jgi:methionyl-tRNA formyltransferase
MNSGATRTLALCGKSWIAVEALELLCGLLPQAAPQWRLKVLPVAGDTGEDGWEPSLKRRCLALGVPIVDSVSALGLGARDLLLSLQYDRIIRIHDLGGACAFNLHFSALPAHRGCYPAVWPILDGDREAGVTLHVLTAGIDDGDIVDQQCFGIPPAVTAFELYRLLHRQAIAVLARSAQALLAGAVPTRPQAATGAVYHDRHSIDFSQCALTDADQRSVLDCDRFLRSRIFPPRQLPTVDGRAVLASLPLPWSGPAGELESAARVVDVDPQRRLLRCADGWLLLGLKSTSTPEPAAPAASR